MIEQNWRAVDGVRRRMGSGRAGRAETWVVLAVIAAALAGSLWLSVR